MTGTTIQKEDLMKLVEFFDRTMGKMNVGNSALDAQAITNWNECGILVRGLAAKAGTPKTYVHVILLKGIDDIQLTIVDEAGLAFINEGGDPPENLVGPYAKEYATSTDEARDLLRDLGKSGDVSADNDRAMAIAGSAFGTEGEYYYRLELDIDGVQEFVNKHHLKLDPKAWEGHIY